jgi:ABC-type glycerol-3-phosphate transport system permease component
MLVSSLKVSHELLASPPTFWPHEWDLRAYRCGSGSLYSYRPPE